VSSTIVHAGGRELGGPFAISALATVEIGAARIGGALVATSATVVAVCADVHAFAITACGVIRTAGRATSTADLMPAHSLSAGSAVRVVGEQVGADVIAVRQVAASGNSVIATAASGNCDVAGSAMFVVAAQVDAAPTAARVWRSAAIAPRAGGITERAVS